LIVSELSDLLEEGDIIVGDYSNAKYTINTVDLNPIRSVAIITTPDPMTSNASSDFGFTEQIIEFPESQFTGDLYMSDDGYIIQTDDSSFIENE
jgi:hypothetical protein